MKLLSCNIWGARQGKILFDYLKKESAHTDIFCFQEVFDTTSDIKEHDGYHMDLLNELKNLLTDFKVLYTPSFKNWVDMKAVDFNVTSGQAIFVRNNINVISSGDFFVFGNKETIIQENFQNEPKNTLWAKLEIAGKEILIVNVHGKWYPGDKTDDAERIEQSRIILDFVKTQNTPKIICGDFNLNPNTESIKMFEREGFKDLIQDYKIENTRNEVSWAQFNNKQYFADFAFVSKDIRVLNFEVPYNLVSDHLPMILQFEV